jgi:hypothetical protein
MGSIPLWLDVVRRMRAASARSALFPPGLYAGLQYRWASLPMLRNRPTKVLLKSLNLNAGSTQAGDLDDRAISWSKQGAFGQFKQIQILGCNIFAEVAGAHTKSLSIDLVEQLGF